MTPLYCANTTMFHGALDIPNGLAVWLFTKGENTDDDWQAYCDALREVSQQLMGHPSPFAVQVIDPSSADPNAKWRRAIAEASAKVPPRSTVAIVSKSRIVRGVITAISWLRPTLYTMHVVASEGEACDLARVDVTGRGARAAAMLARLRNDVRASRGVSP